MALCSNHAYILGVYDDLKKPSSTVYTCSLVALLESRNPSQNSIAVGTTHLPMSFSSVWKKTTDLPVTESTAVSLYDQLLAVGGRDSDNESTSAIYKYNPVTTSWDIISYMPTARHLCFATVISDSELLVVGGETGKLANDSIEIATTFL